MIVQKNIAMKNVTMPFIIFSFICKPLSYSLSPDAAIP
jgi:hypothetical protein